jgi:AcrR family transcriptional regulator
VRRAVLDATLDVLRADGLDRLTVGAVATRAGVHETSIYRRWGTRENLMIDALLGYAEQELPVPDTGSVRGDLRTFATSVAAYLVTPLGTALLRARASTGVDPAVDDARARYWQTRYELASAIVLRAINRGELPDGTDHSLVLELLVAPMHFKVLLTQEPLEPALPGRLVDAILDGVGRR